MTYIVSEDTKISGKCFQLISRSMDITFRTSQSASLSVSLFVLDRQTYFTSQSVCLYLTDRLTSASQ